MNKDSFSCFLQISSDKDEMLSDIAINIDAEPSAIYKKGDIKWPASGVVFDENFWIFEIDSVEDGLEEDYLQNMADVIANYSNGLAILSKI